MSHRYIELFLNSTGGSSGMSLGGIGNFCGGTFYYLQILYCCAFIFDLQILSEFKKCIFNIYTLGLGNNFRPGYSPNRGFSSQLGGSNYNSF